MYVRNMASFENVTPTKPGPAGVPKGFVKSFGDKSAYERFDRLGKSGNGGNNSDGQKSEKAKNAAPSVLEKTEPRETPFPGSGKVMSFPGGVKDIRVPPEKTDGAEEIPEKMQEKAKKKENPPEEPSDEPNEPNEPEKDPEPDHGTILPELSKLFRSLPKDALLLAAVLLLILSEGEGLSFEKLLSGEGKGDLITPLALAYILFF